MKILYFDCKNGISGDMLLNALTALGGCVEQVERAMKAEALIETENTQIDHPDRAHVHDHDHTHHHHAHHTHNSHGRSCETVRKLIEHSSFSTKAKETALNIYRHIAEAEAQVHGATPETVHFHEVGRDEAIRNALGIGMALEAIDPDKIYTSDIYDGKGTVVCSHGEIPVPVPAVQALMQRCSYVFKTDADVHTEMVTPSGLAGLMGIGAERIGTSRIDDAQHSGVSRIDDLSQRFGIFAAGGRVIRETEARGGRDTGRGGLKACLMEVPAKEPLKKEAKEGPAKESLEKEAKGSPAAETPENEPDKGATS